LCISTDQYLHHDLNYIIRLEGYEHDINLSSLIISMRTPISFLFFSSPDLQNFKISSYIFTPTFVLYPFFLLSMSAAEPDVEIEEEKRQRRQLRREQIALHDDMLSNRDKLNELGSSVLNNFRTTNNQLFHKTKFVRESYNDVKNLHELARAARGQAYRLEESDTQYDFDHIVAEIRDMCEPEDTGVFSWANFGRKVSCLFRKVPSFSPMLGLIDKEHKARKEVVRKARAKAEGGAADAPDEVQQTQGGDDEECNEATNERIKRMYAAMSMDAGGAKGDDLLTILVNPTDPVQTVENFFDYSFLIKDKRVVESLNAEGLPETLKAQTQMFDLGGPDGERKQLVVSLGMRDLRTLASVLQEQGCEHKLHRDDALYAAEDAYAQAEILAARAAKVKHTKRKASSSHSSDKKHEESKRAAKERCLVQSVDSSYQGM
jgi:hypothetical protein